MNRASRKQSIDNLLWPRVGSLLGYLEMLVLIGLFTPLMIGTLIPFTPGWITFYVVAVVGCTSAGAVLHGSRERFLAWRAGVAAQHAASARSKVDALIARDRGRP